MTSSSTSDEAFRIERLRRKAVGCLQTFPKKIDELNKLLKCHAPVSAMRSRAFGSGKRRRRKKETKISIIKAPPRVSESSGKSNCSLAICDRNRGIRKRRYYRQQGVRDGDRRRRPGPLGHLLTFIVRQLVFCTRKMLVEPSRFVASNVVSTFSKRTNPTNLESSSNIEPLASTPVLKDDLTNEKLVEIVRPIAIQLISDTTILKQWLQALAVGSRESLPHDLVNASRITETVDYWAYDLFFQLKYHLTKGVPGVTDEVPYDKMKGNNAPNDSILWHRLMELRDKYNILYDGLRKLDKPNNKREPTNSERQAAGF